MEADLSQWIVITGPTASGKTQLAVRVADAVDGEILSIDSRQVFRGMNLGTGKDYEDYHFGSRQIPVHLIDLVDPGDDYHIHRFQQDFSLALTQIQQRKKVPVLCGGSGLYLEAVLQDHRFTAIPVDRDFRQTCRTYSTDELRELYRQGEPLAYRVDEHSAKRLIRALEIRKYLHDHIVPAPRHAPANFKLFIIDLPREVRRQRISERLHQRLRMGMIREVETLLGTTDRYILERYGLEYKYVSNYLHGQLTRDEMIRSLETAIHRFSKRQMTWFRRMERQGYHPVWLDGTLPTPQLLEEILTHIN